jgi:TIR domain
VIQQLVAALEEAGIEIDAEAIADALWLARARHEEPGDGGEEPAAGTLSLPTEPRPPDAEPSDPVDGIGPGSGSEMEPGSSVAPSHGGPGPGAEASWITLPKAHALPRTLELGRALRPLKQRYPSRHHRDVDAGATVQYFCDTGVLTPVMLPGAEHWFDVDVLVDVGPSMAVWQDTAGEFVSILQRHGAFREVRRWSLEQANGTVRLSRAPDVRSTAAQLVNPGARRLTMIMSDCIAPMWYQSPIWEAIREWGLFSPVVIISPLPVRLWPGTAVGSPEFTMRSHRPGAANRLLDVILPWWWPESEPPLSAVPVPVIALDTGQIANWARMAMGAGGAESSGVFAVPPPSKAVTRSENGPPDADELVRRFRVSVSPVAYRLAVYLSAVLRGRWGLALARLAQEAMLPDSEHIHLAEVIVGGLVRTTERPEGEEQPTFEFIDGVVDVLQRSLTGTEALRILQALGGYIERNTGQSPGIAALLLGEAVPADGTGVFADLRTGAANLIDTMGLARVGSLHNHSGSDRPAQAERHLAVYFPRQLSLSAEAKLRVRVSVGARPDQNAAGSVRLRDFTAEEGEAGVTVVAQMPSGLQALSETSQVLSIPNSGESDVLEFPFQAQIAGRQQVVLMAWAGAVLLAELRLEMTIGSGLKISEVEPPATREIRGGLRDSTGNTDRHAPAFYLSYARSQSLPGVNTPDRLIESFFHDLSENVGQLISLPPDVPAGFMDRELRGGMRWSDELLHAIGTCQTLVPLLSARYFNSEWCGMEWYAFSQRTVRSAAEGDASNPRGCIIPVVWAPFHNDLPSPVATTLIFSPARNPEPRAPDQYQQNGILGLMRMGSSMQEYYEIVVWQLAMQISSLYHSQLAEPREFRIEDLRNSFAE